MTDVTMEWISKPEEEIILPFINLGVQFDLDLALRFICQENRGNRFAGNKSASDYTLL